MDLTRGQVFSFGENDLSGLFLVESVSRCVSPSRRLVTTEVAGVDGAYVDDQGLSALTISVTCRVLADRPADVADCAREAAASLAGGPSRLVLPDEPGRYYMARYQGAGSLGGNANMPEVTLSFLCADPVAYGAARTATVGTTSTVVDAGGTWKARPVVTANPAKGEYWTLFNETTGAFVRVEAAFTGSQTVVLDMATERCRVNDSDHPVTLASDFFALDGRQALKCSSGTATLEWAERWL